MKHILVTGAGGFWGYHLAKYLCAKGYRVTGAYHRVRPAVTKDMAELRLDVEDRKAVSAAIKALKPDAVCHLAGQSSLSRAWAMQDRTFSLNTISTIHFLSAIRQHSPSARFVLASSIHVYGRAFHEGRVLKEEDLPDPEGPYGASKRLAELACLDFVTGAGLDCVILRPVNCIGPRLSADFAFSDWSRQIVALEKKKKAGVLEVGNLKVRRDFLHIDDGVRAFEKVLSHGKTGEIYNLSYGKVVPLARYAELLAKRARIPVKIQVNMTRVRKGDPAATLVSSKKIRKLGWKPSKTALEGLGDLLSEWRTRL